MKHGSLFNGIGGFQLAASWLGWENVFHSEVDKFCNAIIAKRFPQSISYGDIKTIDFTIHRNTIDILTGGFPCQPFSIAGKREGQKDERYLWPEMFRAIREIRPSWIVAENVYGIINQSGGMVFEQVCIDLENEGYEVWPFVIPACGVGAWHRRNRIWIIAYSNNISIERKSGKNEGKSQVEKLQKWNKIQFFNKPVDLLPAVANSNGQRFQEQCGESTIYEGKRWQEPKRSDWWETEPGLDRLVNGFPGRVDRLKALGNAIVPQVAYQIFKAIDIFTPVFCD